MKSKLFGLAIWCSVFFGLVSIFALTGIVKSLIGEGGKSACEQRMNTIPGIDFCGGDGEASFEELRFSREAYLAKWKEISDAHVPGTVFFLTRNVPIREIVFDNKPEDEYPKYAVNLYFWMEVVNGLARNPQAIYNPYGNTNEFFPLDTDFYFYSAEGELWFTYNFAESEIHANWLDINRGEPEFSARQCPKIDVQEQIFKSAYGPIIREMKRGPNFRYDYDNCIDGGITIEMPSWP